MIMQDNKKKNFVTAIVAKLKKPDGKEQVSMAPQKDGVEQDSSVGLESAADEIFSAVESKNAKALVSALKSFMQMYDDEGSEPEVDSEMEQEKQD